MRASILEGVSFSLMLGLSVCADSIAERPGGLLALSIGALLCGVPLILAHLGGSGHRRGQAGRHTRKGKKKAAEVVATPQRQMKHRH